MCHARALCHHYASRALSTFPSPDARSVRAWRRRRRRSLARSLDHAHAVRGGGEGGGGSGRLRRAIRTSASRDLCVTYTHARVTTARRARHQRFPFARARSARACCGGGGARSLARSHARGVALAMAMAMAVVVAVTAGYTARHVRCTSHARTRTSSPRMARAINVSLPHARSARVRCGVVAALARSLARSRARRAWRWRWRWRRRSVTPRVICVMRITCAIRLARVRRVITARHQRFPSELSLTCDRHARAAAAVALARLLYRARGLAVAVAVAVGYDARQSCHAHHAAHALLTHTPRHRRASRASSPFPVPPKIGTRAAAVRAVTGTSTWAGTGTSNTGVARGRTPGSARARGVLALRHVGVAGVLVHRHEGVASTPRARVADE